MQKGRMTRPEIIKQRGKITMKMKPLADRVLIEPAEAETKTQSGLYIPDNAKEKPMQGKVVAVGPGKKNDKGEVVPMDVKVGDNVLYGKYSGTEVTADGKSYLIVRESDIFAVL
jgi:chaperonin GroES